MTNNKLNYQTLQLQNATTSSSIISILSSSKLFLSLSKSEGEAILARDAEDDEKLKKGIDFAKEKGVIDPEYVPEPYIDVNVMNKSPDEVADEILNHVGNKEKEGKNEEEGLVIVLCGLSGTGKGTTVTKLLEKIEKEDGKRVVCWSNGNIFRSVTLLAVTWCEQQQQQQEGDEQEQTLDIEKALTKENLESFMNMLEFGKFEGKYDTRINGLGYQNTLLSTIQNTTLKNPKVGKNIPTVAQSTQGEVIRFAADAIRQMEQDAGLVVLLEGRAQTVDYVRTPHRFTLVMSSGSGSGDDDDDDYDETSLIIGKRRAAQRLMAGVLGELEKEGKNEEEDVSEEMIGEVLDKVLKRMVDEI